MADFIIEIIEDEPIPVTYSGHVAYTTESKCEPDSESRYPIKLVGSTINEYGMFTSYVGEQWKYLTIQNISYNSNLSSVLIHYNGVELTNADLPLQFDIEALSGINSIPNLEVVVDNYADSNRPNTRTANITFDIKDIHGTSGGSKLASQQLNLTTCPPGAVTPPTPVIISHLSETMFEDGSISPLWDYQIISQYPVTSFAMPDLPLDGFIFSPVTGYLRVESDFYRERSNPVVLQFQIQAINSAAIPTTDTKIFTLTIPPYITDAGFPTTPDGPTGPLGIEEPMTPGQQL